MGKRRVRTKLLREVREQFRQTLVQEREHQEDFLATQTESIDPNGSGDRGSSDETIQETLGSRRVSTTLELVPGELVNIITTISKKRWSLAPAIVVDGPDRFGEVLLIPLGSSDPIRVPVRRCRPME